MADLPTMPEPPDGAWVVVGDDPHVLLIRDDYSAREGDNEPGHHWFYGHDGSEPPLSWAQLTDPTSPQWMDGWPGADRSVIQRVYTQAELDAAASAARHSPVPEVVGGHVREPAGYCRTDGVVHSPEEWERIAARARETA